MFLSHLNALRALEATLRHGSFTAAAEELRVTPAAVGQRVRTLEDYLGQPLFDRGASGITATEQALRVQSQLTSSFSGLAAVLSELRSGPPTTKLSVTLPASFVENWLSARISGFYQRHAAVDLRLDASNRDVDLITEDFDFAVRYGTQPTESLEAEVLFGDHVLPVCSPEFADQHDLNPTLRSLQSVPLIHITHRTSDPSWVGFSGWGKAFLLDPDHLRHGVQFSKVSSGLQSAIAGQGLVLCGLVEAFEALSAGRLVAPFGPGMNCPTEGLYRLLWVRDRQMTALQRDFHDWLLLASAQFSEGMTAFLESEPV